MKPEPRRLRGGGVDLAADIWGDPDHPPVIFMHGAGQSRRAWDEAARAVTRSGWHAITVDHRGHGDSEWPADAAYEWDHFADDVAALVETFRGPPVLVGASLGGMSALMAQGRASEQLFRGLVLVDVTPRMELDGVKRIMGFMTAHPDGFTSLDEASEVIADYTGRPKPASPDGLRQVLRLGEDGRWRWHWDVRFLEGRADEILAAETSSARTEEMRTMLLDAARQIRVPTLVVRGQQSDMVTPEAVREFVDVVPGSRYIDVADAGHMVAGDQNDTFVDAVLGFLTDLHPDRSREGRLMTGTIMGGDVDDHPDLPARIDAATAMRRLAHAMIAHRVDIATLHRMADAAERLATEIETQPRRGRLEELLASPRFAAAMAGESLSRVIEDGAFVDLFHDSPVSGSASPLSVGLRIRREGDQAIGTVTLAPGWEGAPGRSHGGIVAACVDETIGGLLPIIGTMAFTGHLGLDYTAPCPLGEPLEFRARLDRREGRKLHIACTGTSAQGQFVEATSVFIAVEIDELANAFTRSTDTTAAAVQEDAP